MDWLTIILTILVGILAYRYIFPRKPNKLEELGILHIKPRIVDILSLFVQRKHFTDVITDIYKLDENAKYVGFDDFGEPAIIIRDPELIKSIAVKNFDHFVDHREFVDPETEPLFGRNLFALRGEQWREMGNLLSPAFTSAKMKGMFKLMWNYGENFIDYLVNVSLVKSNIVDTKETFMRYTNDVIATCAFGISIDSMRNPKNDFYVLGSEGVNFESLGVLKIYFIKTFPKTAKFFKVTFFSKRVEVFFENVVRETIETRDREGITRPDMMQLMMEMRGKNIDERPKLTIQDMTAQAFGFFFGGFESTSTLMCFVAHEIAVNPKIQARLRDEVDNVLRETNGDVTYEAVNGMEYLEAVINETLRLYPVVSFLDRRCVKSFELPAALPGRKPVIVEPGQNVWFPAFSIQRDPKYFPNPEQFDPERFMDSAKNHIDPFTYFPFGQGPRMCMGNRFALLETKVLIFNVLKRCHLKPSVKMTLPLEFKKSSLAMLPKGGFWLELEPRNNDIKAL